MPRKLTPRQVAALDHVNAEGEVTIQETADACDMPYATACQALLRLERIGLVTKEPLGDGTRKVIYQKIILENPDSNDPLEQLFCAPAAEVKR